MRVITGSARGRRLNELKGYDTRPTTDKVKEGIFSAIQFEVEGARVLDLFAGTGQLGIEALSRGAQRAVFVDRRTDAVKLIRENLALTRLEEGAQVVCGDSMAYLNALREKFDLIFLDPPYADDLLERAVAHIARFDILAPDGIMIAESPAEKELPKLSAPYRVAREYRYGRIKVTLYRRDGEEDDMREERIAVFPGSFDPVTLGHMDIIERAAQLFDRVYVAIVPNGEKTHPMFTDEEKLELMRVSVAPLGNVEAALWNGLLTDFAAAEGRAFSRARRAEQYGFRCGVSALAHL